MKMLLAVAAGGALGAMGRYLIAGQMLRLLGPAFPYGTLAVNVLGGFAMGCLVEIMALRWSPPAEARAFLIVGLLGGLTTFSAFSLDVALMLERAQFGTALFYILTSVALSVGALFLGMMLFRWWLG